MIDPAAPDFTRTPATHGRLQYDYAPLTESAPPMVSIVTVLPEYGKQLQATARTILGQSLTQWEWLIVGDQSSLATARDELAECDALGPRIHVLETPVKQAVAARNTGSRAARASFVIFLESGDLLEPSALEKMVWFLISFPEYAFVATHVVALDNPPRLDYDGFHEPGKFLQNQFRRRPTLVRRETFTAVGDFDETLNVLQAEHDFWLRCAEKGLWGSTVKEFLVWLSERGDGHRFHERRKPAIPDIQPRWHMPYDTVPNDLPLQNSLRKTRPRALFLLPWLTLGGSDKVNLDLVEQLTQRHGYEISVATTMTGDQSRMPLFAQFTPDIFVLQHFLRLVDYPRFLRYLIESRQIDVVLMSHSHLGYQLLPYLRAHCPNATYVDYCHIEVEQWQNGGYPRASVSYNALLDLAIVSSQHLQNWMVARGADPGRIEICYTHIDPQGWAPDPKVRERVRRELFIPDNARVILFAARLCEQKQPRVFAQVMRQLHKKRVEFTALVVGDGEDRAWLEQYIGENDLRASVKLLGATPYSRLPELMRASDIFFLPSQWEGIALSLFQAMASGLVIVGADVGGQRELVTSDCGVLLPRSDEATEVRRYTETLEQLLQDPARCMALGQRSRQQITERFHSYEMGQRMVDLFQRARQLQETEPRETPSRGLGLACATEAIEFTRLSGVADWLWQQQNKRPPSGKDTPANNGGNLLTRLALRVGRPRRTRQATRA
jgi:glycosyltransferase involved in cell wall biosynthesis